MIKVINNEVLHLLTEVKDYYIESELETADKMIHFLLPKNHEATKDLIQEYQLLTKDDLYLIKEVNYKNKDYVEVFGKLDLDDLKREVFEEYESVERRIDLVLDDLLAETGWTYDIHTPHKLRTVRANDKNALSIIMSAANTYGFEVEFDTILKKVVVKQSIGENRGAYFHSDLNIKRIEYQSDTYDLRTRLYAYGKDGLTFADINDGKTYVENHNYTSKILETVWRDDRYTNQNSLLADAQAKLDLIAKPRFSYRLDVIQLTDLDPTYKILDYRIGDTVKIIDKDNELSEEHRVVKFTSYPLTPEKNKIELANIQLKFKSNEEKIAEIATGEAIKVRTELMEAIDSATEKINAPDKGFVITRKDENGFIYEQLIMDTDDVATASKVWRWNLNGLGYSGTGYNGEYRFAITSDGEINADFITVGTLNANLIKAGLLRSVDGSTWIDMENGQFSFGNGAIIYDGSSFTITMRGGRTLEEELENIELTPGPPGPPGEDGESTYYVQIISENGLLFKNGVIETILSAVVYQGEQDITNTLDANQFRWTRVSFDPESDALWNSANASGTKTIIISTEDVYQRATFFCDIMEV